jgi:hypothetical protein
LFVKSLLIWTGKCVGAYGLGTHTLIKHGMGSRSSGRSSEMLGASIDDMMRCVG